jgi:hypothetical protein
MSAEAEVHAAPPASKYPTHVCAACSEIAGTPVGRDWGGFCVGCGMPLPDPEGSPSTEELMNLGDTFRRVPASQWAALTRQMVLYGAIFAGCSALLLMMPGPALIPGTPLTLANLVWFAVCGPIFMYVAYLCSGFDPTGSA